MKAVEAAHKDVKQAGVKTITSTIHIDERLDKSHTFEEKVESVKKKLMPTAELQ